MNTKKRVLIWIRVVYSFLLSFFGNVDSIYGCESTVEQLLKGKSLIRFGDGEFGIYKGKSIHYQKWSPELKKAFENIKNEYEKDVNNCPYLLAVPKMFMTVNGLRLLRKRVYVSSWAEARYDFKRYFRHDIPYGDAFLFEKKNRKFFSKIWSNEICPDNVMFVHNSEKYAKQFASTYKKQVTFVQCPSFDTFEVVDEIEKTIIEVISKNEWSTKDVMVTISAGPAGKVLAYRLSKCGYWCIDAGHCWDDPLEGI